jgi:hypothetical protein
VACVGSDNVTLHVYMCEWQVHTLYFWQLMHNWQHSVHHSRSAALNRQTELKTPIVFSNGSKHLDFVYKGCSSAYAACICN